MTTETVQALPWIKLRSRTKDPACVASSIPPDHAQNFLRLLARNPLVPYPDATVIKRFVQDLKKRRAQQFLAAFPPTGKRLRSGALIIEDEDFDEGQSDTTDENQAKRRRSSRPNARQRGSQSNAKALEKSRGDEPKVGSDYQAEVPAMPIPEADRTSDMVAVESKMVYSPELCKGDANIEEFLSKVNAEVCRRDGFPLSPRNLEVALTILAEKNGVVLEAFKSTLQAVQIKRETPLTTKPWDYEEKCKFVRAFAENRKDFHHISRNVLKDRSTKELVFMYYTYNKQQRLQSGAEKGGAIFDTGKEVGRNLHFGPFRCLSQLRCLATTAGDGFPSDRRMAEIVRNHRLSEVSYYRRKRDFARRK